VAAGIFHRFQPQPIIPAVAEERKVPQINPDFPEIAMEALITVRGTT